VAINVALYLTVAALTETESDLRLCVPELGTGGSSVGRSTSQLRAGTVNALLRPDSTSNGDKMVIPLTAAGGTSQPEPGSGNVTSTRGATILLIEDDAMIAGMLRVRLEAKGHTVWHAATGAEAEAIEKEVPPDLIIVDVMLPDANGLVLCSYMRGRSEAPIIICTASKRPEDAVLGLKLGADDFIRKPFSTDELEARIEAALRRPTLLSQPPAPEDNRRIVGTLVIDGTKCEVTVGGEPIHLTPTEYRLLCALAQQLNHVVPSTELAQRVWGTHDPAIVRSLQVHVRRMRAKLNAGLGRPPVLLAVRGFGYRLVWESAFTATT
jgi:DNA-binding response OmpR family regulator